VNAFAASERGFGEAAVADGGGREDAGGETARRGCSAGLAVGGERGESMGGARRTASDGG
jgi:hypothetical protein